MESRAGFFFMAQIVEFNIVVLSPRGMFQKIHYYSKNFPTDPWSIPQTPNQQFTKEFLSFGGLGMSGVCSRGMLGFP